MNSRNVSFHAALVLLILLSSAILGRCALMDVTQPGDQILASSANSPGSEGVANAIDGKPTKYRSFDTRIGGKPSGFVVTPSIGLTCVVGMALQSANDAPELDPKVVSLEGSNDETVVDYPSGNWELIVRLDNIPAYTARFQTQTFYFPNAKSYKHYRWTVLGTQTPNDCCMQVAEVELLAMIDHCAPGIPRFLVQPADALALEGSQATFSVAVNGPWPLQWLRNGGPIPDATSPTYTTPAVLPQSAGDVYSVQMCGSIVSDAVRARIFIPAGDSVAINFSGHTASGAPTYMRPDDITGAHPQAFWNNATNAPGISAGRTGDGHTLPPAMVRGDNTASTISFEFQATGCSGSGTGDGMPADRMFSGLVIASVPGHPGTFTFGNVPDGEHALLVYSLSPPLQFEVAKFKVTGMNEQTFYLRTMNVHEYAAAPGFYSSSSTDPTKPETGNMVRFDSVRPLSGVITLTVDCLTPGFEQGTSVNGLQLLLNAPSVAVPKITADPQPAVVQLNGVATLTVTATGQGLAYQWRKNGLQFENTARVSGAKTPTLTICPFQPEDEAIYSVAVFAAGRSTISRNAAVRITRCDISDALAGHWTFDATSGTTAANSSLGGKPATVNGTASWGAGKIGNSFEFDGATYLLVTDYPISREAISAAVWLNIPSGTVGDVAVIRNALGSLMAPVAGQFELGLDFDTATGLLKPMAAISSGPNVVRATGTAAFPLGGWHHLAFSADGARLRLYVDGAEVAVTDYLGEINLPGIPYLSIGARLNDIGGGNIGPDPVEPNFLPGRFDDLGLWTRALPASTMLAIYEAGKKARPLPDVVEFCPTVGPCSIGIGTDIGLRMFDGSVTNRIAAEAPGPGGILASPLRIAKDGTNYGIVLVDTNAPDASQIHVKTSTGIKAWKKLPPGP
jgi:hypothetical protein